MLNEHNRNLYTIVRHNLAINREHRNYFYNTRVVCICFLIGNCVIARHHCATSTHKKLCNNFDTYTVALCPCNNDERAGSDF